MDALILVIIMCALCLFNNVEAEIPEEIMDRETRLNPEFYKDENAFMEVANALVANHVSSDANSAV